MLFQQGRTYRSEVSFIIQCVLGVEKLNRFHISFSTAPMRWKYGTQARGIQPWMSLLMPVSQTHSVDLSFSHPFHLMASLGMLSLGFVGHYGLHAMFNCLRIDPNHRRTPLGKRSSLSRNGKWPSLSNHQRPLDRPLSPEIKPSHQWKSSAIPTLSGERRIKHRVQHGFSSTKHPKNSIEDRWRNLLYPLLAWEKPQLLEKLCFMRFPLTSPIYVFARTPKCSLEQSTIRNIGFNSSRGQRFLSFCYR